MKILVFDDFTPADPSHCCTSMFFGVPGADFVNIGAGSSKAPVATRTLGEIKMGDYSAVFVGKPLRYWNPRKPWFRNGCHLVKLAFKGNAPATLGALAMLKRERLPIIMVDREDRPVIDNSRFSFLKLCTAYFKRELPTNPNNAFLYTTDKTEDSGNISGLPFFQEAVRKLKPISLGISDAQFSKLLAIRQPKQWDLFFAGSVANRPNRNIGLEVLNRLAEEGYRVLVTDKKLSQLDYYQMATRSRICWSPEGFGYECHRTYEVAALGSVPLLKAPPITCYEPFKNGESALYYMHETCDLYDVVKRALQDRKRLVTMGEKACEQVGRYHTQNRIAEHLMEAASP